VATQENLIAKRDYIQKIGSNFRLVGGKALISLSNQWLCAAEKFKFSDWSG